MDYQEILNANDNQVFWEFPPDFDCKREEAAFRRFAKELESVLCLRFDIETGAKIQDASFHSQITIVHSEDDHTLLRFSNFGRLATVYGLNDGEQVPTDLLKAIVHLLGEHGYVYIPPSELEVRYTKPAGLEIGIHDWFYRFFEYL